MQSEPPPSPDPSEDVTAISGADARRISRHEGSSPALAVGDLVAGRYRIEAFIARGGMGEVFRAHDVELGVTVALKTIRADLAHDPAELRRCKQEVLLARSISHPNVCRIFDLGRDEPRGLSFLTMEFLEGETVAARVRREGPLSEEERTHILRQMADGLDSAHRAGIVHRDFKSANVMLVPSEGGDRAVITDFGLAIALEGTRTFQAQASPAKGTTTTRSHLSDAQSGTSSAASDIFETLSLSGSGRLEGTPAYMSPEQVAGGPVGPASDLYALGVVLFEMTTGSLPFQGATLMEMARARLEQPPLKLSALSAAGPRWESMVERLLARDPADRPASGRDLLRLLEGNGSVEDLSRGNLPTERDAFVGRREELASMRRLLHLDGPGIAASSRLLSLLGTGGAGKSRLAIRFGWESRAHVSGGAWFADLSETRSLEGIAAAVARCLTLSLDSGDPIERLGSAIDQLGDCLIILDNFEQIASLAEASLGVWLTRAPRAHFLVTTRERLRLRQEEVLAIEPLDPLHEGLELFELRAQEAQPGFHFDDTNRELVASVVQRVDGLPLAIELAAARLRMLTLTQLELRLRGRLQILTGGQRGRQSTLRATLDWSWELLSGREQAAVRQASLFEGGFSLEAAEAVLDLGPPQDAPLVLDILQALLDKSWIRARAEAEAPRFSMYVTVQEYAAEKLGQEDERSAAVVRHGEYFAALGREIGEAHDRIGGARALVLLQAELDNIIVACRRAVARADESNAHQLFLCANSFLAKNGPWKLAIELGQAVLQIATTPWLKAGIRSALGGLFFQRSEIAEARVHLAESVKIYESLDAHTQAAGPRITLGYILHEQGRIDEAREHYEIAIRSAGQSGNRRVEAALLSSLGLLHMDQGRIGEAKASFVAAVVASIDAGDRRREAVARGNLAILHRQQGSFEEARREAGLSIQCNREVGNRQQEAVMLSNLGNIHLDEGRMQEARAAWETSLELHRQMGSRLHEAGVLCSIGKLHLLERELESARAIVDRSLEISRELGDPRHIATALIVLAQIELREDRLEDSKAHVQEGIELIRALDPIVVALAECTLTEVELRFGDAISAASALERAGQIADQLGVASSSELARTIEEARRLLEGI